MGKASKKFDESGKVPDAAIVDLLTSKAPADQELGVSYLNTAKQVAFCSWLRSYCCRRGWHLHSDDIKEIWQSTLISIWKNAEKGKFKRNGSLDSYVYSIMTRRAVDFLRRGRSRIKRQENVQLSDIPAADCPDDSSSIEFEWRLLDYIRELAELNRLSKNETLVLVHFVTLVVVNNAIPSLAYLTTSVNTELRSHGEEDTTVNAVRKSKERAFEKLSGKNGAH